MNTYSGEYAAGTEVKILVVGVWMVARFAVLALSLGWSIERERVDLLLLELLGLEHLLMKNSMILYFMKRLVYNEICLELLK